MLHEQFADKKVEKLTIIEVDFWGVPNHLVLETCIHDFNYGGQYCSNLNEALNYCKTHYPHLTPVIEIKKNEPILKQFPDKITEESPKFVDPMKNENNPTLPADYRIFFLLCVATYLDKMASAIRRFTVRHS